MRIEACDNDEHHGHGERAIYKIIEVHEFLLSPMCASCSANSKLIIPASSAFITCAAVTKKESDAMAVGVMSKSPNHPAARLVNSSERIAGRTRSMAFTIVDPSCEDFKGRVETSNSLEVISKSYGLRHFPLRLK